MTKVQTVDQSGTNRAKSKRVVVADTPQHIARPTHEPKGKVVVANRDMPNIYETKKKVVKVLY